MATLPVLETVVVSLLMLNVFCICLGAENSLIFSTKECSLVEPVYGYKFDFGKLHSEFAHQAESDIGDKFDFNICGNLTRTCDGRNNVAACLKRGSKEFVLGTDQQLNYHNGRMHVSFSNGGNCTTGTGQFQLHVFIDCDYTLDKIQSKVTAYAKDACSFYIKLETPLACLPEPDAVKSNVCSVKDPKTGHTYDLMPLSDFNYRTTDRNGSAFVINVCKPVLYGENAMCPAGSSICFVDLQSTDFKKKFYDYGTVRASPIIENDQLLIRHTSTTRCNDTENYSSSIRFYCDKDIKSGHPVFGGRNGCLFKFVFATPLACNDLAPCTAITHGSEIIDLRPLMDKTFTLSMQNKKYTFGVCAHAGAPCLENNGACLTQNEQSTSLGISNSNLRVGGNGSPYLLYEGGASCQKAAEATTTTNDSTTTFWSTKIEFVCANNATKDNGAAANVNDVAAPNALGPKIIENSNCQLLIQYQTALACQEQITCKAKVYVDHSADGTGEDVVDLTPLISANENYEAKIDASLVSEKKVGATTKFFLNVCRPLVPTFGLGCTGGSAACMAKVDSSPTPEDEQSLGFPLASMVAINRTSALLRYLRGSTCPTDKNSQLSSGIEFNCDMRAGLGTPILESITDCYYQFKWATNIICPPHMCNFNAHTCEITNDDINVNYNIKEAPFAAKGEISIKKDKHDFKFNVCGEYRLAMTDYSQSLVNIFFSTPGPCDVDGLVNVQMRLICSSETSNDTSVSDGSQCNLIYTQRTPDICKFLGFSVPLKLTVTTSTTTTTSTTAHPITEAPKSDHSAERTGSFGAILAAILTLSCLVACIGLLAFSPRRRASIRRLFQSSTAAVRYSRVQSNEEANLLLETNGEFTDSDDDMLL